MSPIKRAAVAAGVLFIIATGTALGSSALTGPAMAGDAGASSQAIAGALLTIAAGASSALIATALFPVLKEWSEGLAVSYVAVPLLEGVTLLLSALTVLLIVTANRQHLGSDLVALLHAANGWLFPMNPTFSGPGTLLLSYVLYRSKLVPRWLSVWGLIAGVSLTAFAVMAMFGQVALPLALPIAVREMVLAVWLIVRGFGAAPDRARVAMPAGRAALGSR